MHNYSKLALLGGLAIAGGTLVWYLRSQSSEDNNSRSSEDTKSRSSQDDKPRKLRDRDEEKAENLELQTMLSFLFNVPLLRLIPRHKYPMIALASKLAEFSDGELVAEEGCTRELFLVLKGEFLESSTGHVYGSTDFFGSLGDKPLQSNVIAKGAADSKLAVLKVSRSELFKLTEGTLLVDILEQTCQRVLRGSTHEGKISILPQSQQFQVEKLEKLGVVGEGNFGFVELHKHKQTEKHYSVKHLWKGYVVKTDMQDSVLNERLILAVLDSPFITKLYTTTRAALVVSFVMDACLGGDLYAAYNRNNLYGLIDHAQYYLASLAFGLDYMHDRRIVYRDLKPENCLLDAAGHLKLCDMGLAKLIRHASFTICGTPHYFSPEMIQNQRHDWSVDWWSWGVFLFELLSGHPPFEAASVFKIYSNISKGIDAVEFPKPCQREAKNLIKAMLERSPNQRLAMRPGGIANIQKHPFFKGFDWDGLLSGKLQPPHVPAIKDLSTLPAEADKSKEQDHQFTDDGSKWDEPFGEAL